MVQFKVLLQAIHHDFGNVPWSLPSSTTVNKSIVVNVKPEYSLGVAPKFLLRIDELTILFVRAVSIPTYHLSVIILHALFVDR